MGIPKESPGASGSHGGRGGWRVIRGASMFLTGGSRDAAWGPFGTLRGRGVGGGGGLKTAWGVQPHAGAFACAAPPPSDNQLSN